jgi:hypothetical protein
MYPETFHVGRLVPGEQSGQGRREWTATSESLRPAVGVFDRGAGSEGNALVELRHRHIVQYTRRARESRKVRNIVDLD